MFTSTKVIELGSCAFRQWRATHSHCQYIHGYQLKAKFVFGCKELDEKNWAVDFGSLKELKQQLQHVFDHTYCVAADDPMLDQFKALDTSGIIQLRIFDKGVGIERVAEKCFEMASEFIKDKYGDRCWVKQVEAFEHEDNSAIFCDCGVFKDEEVTQDDTENESPAPQHIEITPLPMPEVTRNGGRAANIGPNVSSGKGDWFKGTTWG
jgi:6-pyruvoyltetrahydropterin/6-carboxytetrahydropterin synthase